MMNLEYRGQLALGFLAGYCFGYCDIIGQLVQVYMLFDSHCVICRDLLGMRRSAGYGI